MAKINFPNNRDQLVPPLPTGALQDGDTTNITADGVTITYEFKKPASPNTDSWWKSMGRVNNATPLDKIEEGNSSVEVIDTGTNGQVVVTTDGTARAKFRTDGSFVVGGNLDTDPAIQLFDNGNGIFQEDVRSYRWNSTDNIQAYLGANSTTGTGAASMNARKGLLIYETSGPTRVAEIDIDGNAAFASGKVRVDKSGTLRVSTDVSSSGAGGVLDIIPGNSGTDGVTFRTLAWEAGALNQGPLKFTLGAPQVERVRFNTNGNVEIGGTIGTSPNITLSEGGSIGGGDNQNGSSAANQNGYLIAPLGRVSLRKSDTETSDFLSFAKYAASGNDRFRFRVLQNGSTLIAPSSSATTSDANIVLNADGSAVFKSSAAPHLEVGYGTSGTGTHRYAWDSSKLNIQADIGDDAASSAIQFGVDGTNVVQINESGKLILQGTSVEGIQFGSTDSGGNITSQTLDDYEEGTWTCTLAPNSGFTPTSNTLTGTYTKIGRKVTVVAMAQMTVPASLGTYVNNTTTSLLNVTGLPFNLKSASRDRSAASIGIVEQLAVIDGYLTIEGNQGSNAFTIAQNKDNGSTRTGPTLAVNSTVRITFQFTYFTDS